MLFIHLGNQKVRVDFDDVDKTPNGAALWSKTHPQICQSNLELNEDLFQCSLMQSLLSRNTSTAGFSGTLTDKCRQWTWFEWQTELQQEYFTVPIWKSGRTLAEYRIISTRNDEQRYIHIHGASCTSIRNGSFVPTSVTVEAQPLVKIQAQPQTFTKL